MKRSLESSEREIEESKQQIMKEISTKIDSIQFEIVTFCFNNTQRNIFITGQGGTGKSFMIETICKVAHSFMRNIVVTASTGCAAVNIKGITLHSFVGIGLGNEKRDYSALLKPDAKKRIQRTDILIIDEVSMINPEYLNKANEVIQKVRNSKSFFGGIQVILVGDFFQLPPVSKEKKGTLTKKYIFQDEIWTLINPSCHVLKKNYRQIGDEVYTEFLSKMRCGKLTRQEFDDVCKTLKSKQIPKDEDVPRLFSRRDDAEHYNTAKLNSLTGAEYIYESHGVNYQKLENFVNVGKKLVLKLGAGVLLCKNLDLHGGLCNGTYGEVVGFEKALSDTKTYPMVKFEGIYNPMKIIEHKWEMQNEKGQITANLFQLPLMLSYGITIHKSQGMTLSKVVINPGFFENGQAYVAFSRVKNLSGAYLESNKNMYFSSIKTDQIVVKFYEGNNLL
jgi:ATP-dependent DNA helicase PIF1